MITYRKRVSLKFYQQTGMNLYDFLQVGDESYESYIAEKDGILLSLARRAKVSRMKIMKLLL